MNKKIVLLLLLIVVVMIVILVNKKSTPSAPSSAPRFVRWSKTNNDTCIADPDSGIAFEDQSDGTLQICNNTTQDPLHVFLEVVPGQCGEWYFEGQNSVPDVKDGCQLSSVGTWGGPCEELCPDNCNQFKDEEGNIILAWNPMGANVWQEVTIPMGGSVTLTIPNEPGVAKRVMPVGTIGNVSELLMDDPINAQYKVYQAQAPVLIEGGIDVVSDASAVDGINFALSYTLTSDENTVKTTCTKQTSDPVCGDYGFTDGTPGCVNPARLNSECGGSSSAECVATNTEDCDPPGEGCVAECGEYCGQTLSAAQNCRFSQCSRALFKDPNTSGGTDDQKKYWNNSLDCKEKDNCSPACLNSFDGGKQAYNCSGDPVKSWVGDLKNISDPNLKKFCDVVGGAGDFTTYCYDYADQDSSPWLRSPFKMKIVYADLV